MDYFQRNWKPGGPNLKYPGGIPCHRHKQNDLDEFEEKGVLGKNIAGLLSSASACVTCNSSIPSSPRSDSICGICKREYSEAKTSSLSKEEWRTRKITKPNGSAASIVSRDRNVDSCRACPKPPGPEHSDSSCGICSHLECKKPLREDLAVILSVLDKNKGCDCGAVARALRTGVHGFMRIDHRSSGPVPPENESIRSEGVERKVTDASDADAIKGNIDRIKPTDSIAIDTGDNTASAEEKVNDV